MQEINLVTYIKKVFASRNVASVFLTSLFSFLIVALVGVGLIFHYRGTIFGYFAKEYLQEVHDQNEISKGDVKTPAFSQDSFVIDAVKKTNPAVVSIIISKEVPKYETYTDPNQDQSPFGDLFPGFSLNIPQYRQNGTQKQDIGGGSGFFVSNDGLIVTNKHVVDEQDAEYTVFTNDGKKHSAKVVTRDPILDIALIKIDGTGFPYLSLGDSDSLEVGQSVIAIGNALGEYRNTVSVGVVSGLARSITAGDSSSGSTETLDHVIQTDAAINPGNSGGPLLDLSGNVIGVNVAIAEGSQNIGFALPINTVRGAIDSVKATGKIIRPYLGLRYVAVTPDMKQANSLTVDYGALVKSGNANELAVIPGSPADKAGIVENDIILEVDGVKLDDKTSLASIIRSKNVGQVVNLKILHRGTEKNVSVTLEAAKDN